jgi:hypothetical protein
MRISEMGPKLMNDEVERRNKLATERKEAMENGTMPSQSAAQLGWGNAAALEHPSASMGGGDMYGGMGGMGGMGMPGGP